MFVIDDETRRFGRILHYSGVLASVVFATVVYSLLYLPTANAISKKSLRIDELTLSVQNAPLIREQHRKVAELLREVELRIAAVQRRVPRHADGGAFLKQITEIADTHQLSIKDFQPEVPTAKVGYAEMQVMLKGRGSYASICAFLDGLNKLTRLSKVQDLTLSAADGAAEYPMTATLIIYFGLRGADAKTAVRESPETTSVVRGSPDPALGRSPDPARPETVRRPAIAGHPQEDRHG